MDIRDLDNDVVTCAELGPTQIRKVFRRDEIGYRLTSFFVVVYHQKLLSKSETESIYLFAKEWRATLVCRLGLSVREPLALSHCIPRRDALRRPNPELQHPENHDVLVVVHAELVVDGVAVLGRRPRVLGVLQVEAADEHELAVWRVLAKLRRLSRIGRAIEAAAEHPVRGVANLEPVRLDVGRRLLRAAVEEERVPAAIGLRPRRW